MDDERPQEGFAIPSMDVKYEQVQSIAQGNECNAKHLVETYLHPKTEQLKGVLVWTIDLFLWLEWEIDYDDAKFKGLKELQDWTNNPSNKHPDISKFFMFNSLLRRKAKDLKITDLKLPPSKGPMKNPLLRSARRELP